MAEMLDLNTQGAHISVPVAPVCYSTYRHLKKYKIKELKIKRGEFLKAAFRAENLVNSYFFHHVNPLLLNYLRTYGLKSFFIRLPHFYVQSLD